MTERGPGSNASAERAAGPGGPAASGGIYEELRPLFYPRSVAVVGVSQDTWKPGSTMLRALLRFGFAGRLYPVSGKGGELMGLKVCPSVASLPEAVDLAFLFVPAQALPSVVRQCREKGVKAGVAFTGGFGETGTEAGKALEAELIREFDGSFRMVGPNCLGLYCPAGGITQHPGEGYPRASGEVSFVAQSGGISEDFARATPNFGFHVSKVISYGNACDLNEADLLEYMQADPATAIVGMYIEGARDGRRFARALRRTTTTKPVVVWKGGVTPQGAAAVGSHTGSLAGSLRVWETLLRQVGAVQVGSLEQMLDTLAAFHFLPGLADLRIGYVCAGGGNSVVAADAAYRAGLVLPRMSPETRDKIASFLPPVGSTASNPVDMLAPMPSPPTVRGVLEAMAGSGEVAAIVLDRIVLSKELRRLMNYAEQAATEDEPWLSEIPIEVHRSSGIPVVVVLRENLDPTGDITVEAERLRLRRYYQENGIAVYPTPDRAFRALGHVIGHYRRGETA
jgi:acetate---CoA ligase (ADP-forming) subunit alpha